ncbi:protein YLS3 isoform X1 [Selaginella moellendorffii]|uniref:protein YLS3 isoform X1 n=1 Tax=Selaginella moellendorffii TaxID=88036 RepID=UPI000D1C6332|nr:protein YLS3 isoform X1 [Selaginella moellendorffii]|eukprot:XP_024539293.1 protein YLS3 isoform X1 [Selaginella moellendorffii]
MASPSSSSARVSLLVLLLPLVVHLVLGEDKQCTARLARIQPCITYIEGKRDLPGSRCCRGLHYIYQHSPVCLCELLSSTGGVTSTPGINITNAVMLPTHCKLDSNTSACPTLLEQNSAGRSDFSPLVTTVMFFLAQILF